MTDGGAGAIIVIAAIVIILLLAGSGGGGHHRVEGRRAAPDGAYFEGGQAYTEDGFRLSGP